MPIGGRKLNILDEIIDFGFCSPFGILEVH